MFDSAAHTVGEALGVSTDYVKLLGCLLAAIPLSYPIAFLPATAKHFYNICVSFVFIYNILNLRWGFAQLVFMSISTYGLCKWGIHSNKSKELPVSWPWMVFWLTMGQLVLNHIYRYIVDIPVDEIEISGTMMVLVMRLNFFAWDAYDKASPEKENPVHLIPFLGYCFFIPCFLIGPGIHYNSYIENTVAPLPPGRFVAAAKRFVIGAVCLGIFATQGSAFSYGRILEPGFIKNSLFSRIVFTQLAGFVARMRYYGVWCIAESGCIISGQAQTPSDPTDMWAGAKNVKILAIEFAENWKMLLDSCTCFFFGNCFANVWLRETIYKRLATKGQKPGFQCTMATFGTSALWHGVNVNYYFTFFLGGFLQSLGKYMRHQVRPLFLTVEQLKSRSAPATTAKRVYDVMGWFCVQLTLNYAVVPFMLLEVRPVFTAWYRLGFYGHVMTFVPLGFFWLGGASYLKSLQGPKKSEPEIKSEGAPNDVNILGKPEQLDEAVQAIEELKKRA